MAPPAMIERVEVIPGVVAVEVWRAVGVVTQRTKAFVVSREYAESMIRAFRSRS